MGNNPMLNNQQYISRPAYKSTKQMKKDRKKAQKEAQKQAAQLGTQNKPTTNTVAQVTETPQQTLARQVQLAKQQQEPGNTAGQQAYNQAISRIQTAPGFRPEQAAAMQHQAYKNAQRMGQTSQRALLGEQSQRGIGGRSGIGYAQQRDINKSVAAQQAQSLRAFQRLNAEQGMANAGAGYAAEAGAQSRMDTDIESQREEEERRKYRLANPNSQQFMKIG